MSQLSCGTFQSISGRDLFLKLPEFCQKISHNSHWLKLHLRSLHDHSWVTPSSILICVLPFCKNDEYLQREKREGVHLKKIYVCQFRKILSFCRVFQQNLTTMAQYRTNRTAIVMQGCPLELGAREFSPATMSVSSGYSYRKQKENRTKTTS